jgi:hypothetical protein
MTTLLSPITCNTITSIVEDLTDIVSNFPSIPTTSPDDFDLWFQNLSIIPSPPHQAHTTKDITFLQSLSATDHCSVIHSPHLQASRPLLHQKHFHVLNSDHLRHTALVSQAMTVANLVLPQLQLQASLKLKLMPFFCV